MKGKCEMGFRLVIIGCAAFGCATLTGCLLSHSHHTVIRQGEPLQRIGFESPEAKASFESHVEALIATDGQSKSSLTIPFLLGLSRSETIAENAIRNDAAIQFDLNSDRIIDDYEVTLQK